jgi:hypothetical protein
MCPSLPDDGDRALRGALSDVKAGTEERPP